VENRVFEAVRYSEIQRDIADTAGYSLPRTDTAGYSGMQRDTVDLLQHG